jgi:hypothetical protein
MCFSSVVVWVVHAYHHPRTSSLLLLFAVWQLLLFERRDLPISRELLSTEEYWAGSNKDLVKRISQTYFSSVSWLAAMQKNESLIASSKLWLMSRGHTPYLKWWLSLTLWHQASRLSLQSHWSQATNLTLTERTGAAYSAKREDFFSKTSERASEGRQTAAVYLFEEGCNQSKLHSVRRRRVT